MELTVLRSPTINDCTIGDLMVDGIFECWTLEQPVREVAGEPVEQWKVPGKTAIPIGRYRVIIDHSKRFNRDLPRLLDVPGFEGVRIHTGNTAADTEGCILVGSSRTPGSVLRSTDAFSRLLPKIQAGLAEGNVWIAILNRIYPIT